MSEVHDKPELSRYEIRDGDEVAGFSEYRLASGTIAFTHTEVDGQFEGRGLATILVGEALQQTRSAGKRIVPQCKLVTNYVEKHGEYADIVDPVDG